MKVPIAIFVGRGKQHTGYVAADAGVQANAEMRA